MTNPLEAIVEILSWVALASGSIVGIIALLARAADGTWVRVDGYVDHEPEGAVVRWFDEEGQANAATLSAADLAHVGDRDTVEVFARRGVRHRMRVTRSSPAVRGLAILAGVLLGVGLLALLISIVLLFVG